MEHYSLGKQYITPFSSLPFKPPNLNVELIFQSDKLILIMTTLPCSVVAAADDEMHKKLLRPGRCDGSLLG